MISYELAKSLKDAGFPQAEESDCMGVKVICPHFPRQCPFISGSCGNEVDVPELSDLIEACGFGTKLVYNGEKMYGAFNDWCRFKVIHSDKK